MNRQQKEAVVADFKDMFTQAQASFLVRYRGLSVKDMLSLRRALREKGAQLKVTKARLMKIAAKDIEGIESFREDFKDQIGLVFALNEVPAVANRLVAFSKEHESLSVLAGFFEAKMLSKKDVEFLASLPSKEVLIAQLAGTLQAPIAYLARALQLTLEKLDTASQPVAKESEQ